MEKPTKYPSLFPTTSTSALAQGRVAPCVTLAKHLFNTFLQVASLHYLGDDRGGGTNKLAKLMEISRQVANRRTLLPSKSCIGFAREGGRAEGTRPGVQM